MVAGLSFTEQVKTVIPSIFFEKIAVLNNYGYRGLNHIFDSISRCDGFFNVIIAKPLHLLPRQVVQLFCSFTVENGVPESTTFHLEGKEKENRISPFRYCLWFFKPTISPMQELYAESKIFLSPLSASADLAEEGIQYEAVLPKFVEAGISNSFLIHPQRLSILRRLQRECLSAQAETNVRCVVAAGC